MSTDTPAAAPTAEREAFESAMKQSWQMVDALNPSGVPGSYARGEHNGICAALKTVRENFERAALSAPVAAQPAASGVDAAMQINLSTEEVAALRDWIANDDVPAPVVLSVGEGHSGFGLYAWTEDYPEEGAVFIKALPALTGAPPTDEVMLNGLTRAETDATASVQGFAAPAAQRQHVCMGKLSGNLALDVLRQAMADAGTSGPMYHELIRRFCDEWTKAAAPAAQPADSAMEVLRELVEGQNRFSAYRSTDGHAKYKCLRERYYAAWNRARALVAKETPHAR